MRHIAHFTFTIENTEISLYYQENMILENPWPNGIFHMHPLHEIFVMIDDGASVYGDAGTIELEENDVCIMPPQYMHTVAAKKQNPQRIAMWFTYKKLRHTDSVFDFYALIHTLSMQNAPLRFHAGKMMVSMLVDIISNMTQNQLSPINEIKLRNIFSLLFIQLSAQLPSASENGKEQYPKSREYYLRLVRIDDLTSKRIYRNESVEDLAKQLYLSPRQLSNIFHNEYHMSIKSYSYYLRIQRAAHMLECTDMPIAKISEAVGYGSSEIFAIMFKRYFGTTPSQYLKSKQQKQTP